MLIRKVGVLGAGVMGSGIAAHLANAGIQVELLDMKAEWSSSAIEKALKTKPAPFMHKDRAKLIRTGSFEENMNRLADCEWVVEVVVEDPAIKEKLFAQVLPHLGEKAILTSNTSGIPITTLTKGFPDDVKRRFFVTHFFNPVRYMRLLELIPGELTDMEMFGAFGTWATKLLGKGIVVGKDTVNFVANRIGVYGMMLTLRKTMEMGYTLPEVDAVTGPAMGHPGSATYKTADLVGLDTLVHVANNCYDNLPGDEERDIFKMPDVVVRMVKEGWTGRKAGGGFYKRDKATKTDYALNLETFEYEVVQKPVWDSLKKAKSQDNVVRRIKGMLKAQDRGGELARAVILPSMAYAARRVGEIAEDVKSIDDAMRWGFAWDLGPFELWQDLGVAFVNEMMEAHGIEVPALAREAAETGAFYKDGVLPGSVTVLKQAGDKALIKKTPSTRLVDLGDGVVGFDFFSKMNALDDGIVKALDGALDYMEERGDVRGMVIANDGAHFSVGANIMMIQMAIQQKAWDKINDMLKFFQDTFQRLHKSSKPVVAAPHNMALGGGCELCLCSDAIRAHAELYMGLVEFGVGLIPGACGTLELLKRHMAKVPVEAQLTFDRFPYVARTFVIIGMVRVATSAQEARESFFLREGDKISFDRGSLVEHAKMDVINLSEAGYAPAPEAQDLILPGVHAVAAMDNLLYSMELGGYISAHDHKIARKLAHVLTGGDIADGFKAIPEQTVLDLEREAFLSLCGEELTLARIEHMLKTGKPLRN